MLSEADTEKTLHCHLACINGLPSARLANTIQAHTSNYSQSLHVDLLYKREHFLKTHQLKNKK